MKILQVSTEFNTLKLGGAERMVHHLATNLSQAGQDVTILTCEETESFENVKIINIPKPLDLSTRYEQSLISVPSLFNMSQSIRIKKIVKEFDIIHIHNVHSYSILFNIIKVAKSLGKKIVWTPHDYWFICPKQTLMKADYTECTEFNCNRDCLSEISMLRKIGNKRRRLLNCLKLVDMVLPPSNYMKRILMDFGIEEVNILLLYNGIDIRDLEPSPTISNKILFVGHVDKRKGTHYLVNAIPHVKMKIPNIEFIIVGNGPEILYLKDRVKELNIVENVDFTGRISDDKLKSIYKESSVVVLPSIWPENCSVVILEAMAHGKPVITTDIGGNPELVEDGMSGFIVKPKDSLKIAEKLIKLLSNDELVLNMGLHARKRIERDFTIQIQANKTIEVYSDLCLPHD